MPYLRPYRVAETTTSTGTGSITLAGAVTGYATFAADLANADTATIVIEAIDGSGAPTGEWEICDTTFTSPSTLSRGTLRDSSTGSRISFAAGTKRVFAISPLNTTNVQIFSAVGTSTWTKPVGAQVVRVIAISGGGGGGSGRRGASASSRTGGNGGNGGLYVDQVFEASALTDTVTVTVGGGGAGGASITANSTNGNNGVDGSNTTFGNYVRLKGGFGGVGGRTGFSANFSTPAALFGFGNQGGNGQATGGGTSFIGGGGPGAPGGGGGGGLNTSNALGGGGQGLNTTRSTAPFWINGNTAEALSNIVTGNGAAGTDLTTANWVPGESGDGGGPSHTGNAGNGGNGGKWGGGGGGGGASTDSVGNSGAGGAGGDGLCVVVTYF